MKGRPIDHLVYETMFPKPKSTDPQNFQGLLQRQLVPEVRLETQAFYGHLASQEAKYPGLDYSYQPHRLRLSRYPWHRRLFRAFDNLRLTRSEIASLTKWEGTRWAKERYEREQGIVIRDTTGDGIRDWIEPERRVSPAAAERQSTQADHSEETTQAEGHDLGDDADDSDMELHESVGIELNRRLRAAAAQREAGNLVTVMDEEWEQWLKDAAEAGAIPELGLSPNANIPGTRPAPGPSAFSPEHTSQRTIEPSPEIRDYIQRRMRELGVTAPSAEVNQGILQTQRATNPSAQVDGPSAFVPGFNHNSRRNGLAPANIRPFGRPVSTTTPGMSVTGLETRYVELSRHNIRPLLPLSTQASLQPTRTNEGVGIYGNVQEGRAN